MRPLTRALACTCSPVSYWYSRMKGSQVRRKAVLAQIAGFAFLGLLTGAIAFVLIKISHERKFLRRYRQDMKHARSSDACVWCGGTATELRRNNEGMWVCKDRDLCRTTIVYRNLLDSGY